MAAFFAGDAPESPIKLDETVVFFPTHGRWDEKEAEWVVRVHGWIFERSLRGQVAYPLLKQTLDLRPADEEERKRLDERAGRFLVDNEGGKEISIVLGGRTFTLDESAANGHFQGDVRLSEADAKAALIAAKGIDDESEVEGSSDRLKPELRTGWIEFQAVTRADDKRSFAGRARLIDPRGVSVISDIDDTIKITGVGDRRAMLSNTFLKEFRPVEGMAEFYRGLANDGAAFHYVTASPWQLQPPLAEFLAERKFPVGTFHMKNFRWSDSSFFDLFRQQTEYKTAVIERLLADFPKRTFLLVGDAGEQDPEIYGELARRHGEQIDRVLIRARSKAEAGDAERWAKAFGKLPAEKWRVFRAAEELESP